MHPLTPCAKSADVPPGQLLAMLSHCYACEVYGSTEVQNALMADPAYQRFWRGDVPDVATIQRFRKANQKALRDCLALVLRDRAERKLEQGVVAKLSQVNFDEEAKRRLVTAMYTDTVEMDGN